MQRDPPGFWCYIKEDTHSIGLVTGVINLLVNHFLQDLFYSFSAFNGDLPSGMLNWGIEGLRQMVYAPGILPVVSQDLGKDFLGK